jgi:hypothetical protein
VTAHNAFAVRFLTAHNAFAVRFLTAHNAFAVRLAPGALRCGTIKKIRPVRCESG